MATTNETEILTPALEKALADWSAWKEDKPLIYHYDTDQEYVEPLVAAIEKCDLYRAMAGNAVFTGYSGVVIMGQSLAMPLLVRADPEHGLGIAGAIAWFKKVLTTRAADGIYGVAIWGIAPDKSVEIAPGCTIEPFATAADSSLKRRIIDLKRETWDGYVWHSTRFYDAPGAIMIRRIENFPYQRRINVSFQKLRDLDGDAKNQLALMQATLTGHPVVGASWFVYEDEELDFNGPQNFLSWCVPEVEPLVRENVAAPAERLAAIAAAIAKLSGKYAEKLRRSADRFALSQCRHNPVDKILDLVIAFEILTSSDGEQAPPGMKVSIRSAQVIGGQLKSRQHTRETLTELCRLRNVATHGGSVKEGDFAKRIKLYAESSNIYRTLVDSILSLGTEPEWAHFDLEPRTRE